jgi:hypothetical protein
MSYIYENPVEGAFTYCFINGTIFEKTCIAMLVKASLANSNRDDVRSLDGRSRRSGPSWWGAWNSSSDLMPERLERIFVFREMCY